MDLQFWPGAVVMMFIAAMTTSLVTSSGRSAWFVGCHGADGLSDFRDDALHVAAPSGMSTTRVLEPIDRVSEVLFGLIMVLTFTGSLSVAEAGRDDVRTMLVGALGCNVAWGVIDAMLYLMDCLAKKSQGLMTYMAVRKATDPLEAQRLIADALPSVVASILEPVELERMRRRLAQLPQPPERARLSTDEWLGSVGVFLSCSPPRFRW